MRTTVVVLLCGWMSGCTFGVRGLDVGGDQTPGASPGTPQPQPQPHDLSTAPATHDGGVVTPPAQPDLAPPPVTYGEACDSDPSKMSCGSALFCLSGSRSGSGDGSSMPDGYCSSSCDSASCPTGTQCGTVGDRKYCLAECPAAGCRTGYICCTKNFNPGVCLTSALCD